MTFQDDTREQEMRALFNLKKDGGRGDVDAFLAMDNGVRVDFELKTTSDRRRSVTTVRDFGFDHIKKWEHKHWLFAFYDGKSKTPDYLYGSPKMMAPWIEKMAHYIRPDYKAAEVASTNLSIRELFLVIGEKKIYSLEDAISLQKKQFSKTQYLEMMDLENGYSPERMLEIFQNRVKYLVERGSTLNNPHISGTYFSDWKTHIRSDHGPELRRLVRLAIANKL